MAGYHATTEQDYKWCESQAYIKTVMSWQIRNTIGLQAEDVVNGITVRFSPYNYNKRI
jgi:hypothetical protein